MQNCRVCDKSNFEEIIDLGLQPWGNDFLTIEQLGKEKKYPLRLIQCKSCSLVQLDFTVPKDTMFSNHTYLSGITKSLKNHFEQVKIYLQNNFGLKAGQSILDIGSNDGTFLKVFSEFGLDVTGVESSGNIAKIAQKNGINTINDFFNYKLADNLNRKFDFINASGVFFHLEELHSVTKGIKKILSKDGIFIVQFIYFGSMQDKVAFDQIYHEHLLYYTLETLNNLFKIYDLEIFDSYLADIHGGQMVCFVSHKNKKKISKNFKRLYENEKLKKYNSYEKILNFKKNILLLKETNLKFISQNIENNKLIFGFGAPVKGNTLLNYFGLNSNHIKYLVEKNSLRKNLYAPGSHIPIKLEDELEILPDIYYVLAWNFKKEIIKNNQDLITKNNIQFFFPVET